MRKNVLVIITSLTGGGAERVATNLATFLSKKENVILVVEHIDRNTYGSTTKTIDLKMPFDKGRFKLIWHMKLFFRLKRIKKKYRITHSISFLPEPSLANVLSKKKDFVIVSERSYLSDAAKKKNKLWRIKEEWVLKHSDKVVALSNAVRKDIINNFHVKSENVVTIYNPCDTERIERESMQNIMSEYEMKLFSNSDKIVVTAGRLVDEKGQWHLIRAFKQLVEEDNKYKLVILGQGENYSYLKKLIQKLKLHNNVFLLGYKENPYPYILKSNLFVFPSITEGLGNIIVECMACGTPVISTDCRGPRELLDPSLKENVMVKNIWLGEFGILVPTPDGIKYSYNTDITKEENTMAKAIDKIFKDPQLYNFYKYRIKERAKDFLPEIITTQWELLLRQEEIY